MTPGICQSGSTATFSTLFHFPCGCRNKAEVSENAEPSLRLSRVNPQKISQPKPKQGYEIVTLRGKSRCKESRAASPDALREESRRGGIPQAWAGPRHAQLRGLVCFPGRAELSLFSFSENVSSRLRRGEPSATKRSLAGKSAGHVKSQEENEEPHLSAL